MIKTYNSAERQAGTRLVGFNIIKSGKRFLAKRVRLRNDIFSRLRQRFFRQKAESNNLVKKSVRVDSDIFNALLKVAHNDEKFFTKIINSAVVNEISTKQIDLIKARWFKHKVTVYFTQDEYRRVQDVLNELRSRKITSVTFSSLVRSILYKHLGVVQEIEHNMKAIEEVA
ncbi:MAG: hypothetical protein ACI4S3_04510 [Candidatus Gastranaerophilaceae bacterium]